VIGRCAPGTQPAWTNVPGPGRANARGAIPWSAGCSPTSVSTLKKELTRRRSWPTCRELESAIFAWIEGWYNRRRLHSTLGYLSPADYENSTLSESRSGLAASRLAHSPIMIKEKAA
jgi:Integrase core domain